MSWRPGHPSHAAAIAALVAFMVAAAAGADDDTVQACTDAHHLAQRQRKEGQLRDARRSLAACARTGCPDLVRADCARWAVEVDTLLPTVVLSARDASGHDLADVSVTVDDQPLVERLDGKEVAVDPGTHRLRFTAAGSPPVEQTLLIREGEHARPVAVTIPSPPPKRPPAPARPEPVTVSSRPVPAAVFVFGGLTLAAAGSFAYFGLNANAVKSKLDSEGCRPNCNPSDVHATTRDAIIADASWGIGLVSLGLATYFFFTRPTVVTEVAEHTRVHVGASSTSVAWSTRF